MASRRSPNFARRLWRFIHIARLPDGGESRDVWKLGPICIKCWSRRAVTLNDGGISLLEAVARDTNVSFDNEIVQYRPTTPGGGTVSRVATQSSSSSQVSYTLTQEGFQISSTTMRDGALDSRANAQGNIYFSV